MAAASRALSRNDPSGATHEGFSPYLSTRQLAGPVVPKRLPADCKVSGVQLREIADKDDAPSSDCPGIIPKSAAEFCMKTELLAAGGNSLSASINMPLIFHTLPLGE